MDKYIVFPDKPISNAGKVSNKILELNIETFWQACRFVHELPYGYNSNKDDLMIIFKEKMGMNISPKTGQCHKVHFDLP